MYKTTLWSIWKGPGYDPASLQMKHEIQQLDSYGCKDYQDFQRHNEKCFPKSTEKDIKML